MGGVADVFSGGDAADAAKHGARAQMEWLRKAIGTQEQYLGGQMGLYGYGAGIGNQALGQLAGLYGLTPGYNPAGSWQNGQWVAPTGGPPGGGAGGQPDFSAFFNSPDYAYARDEALAGVNANQASMGNLFSGARGQALTDRASGLATQNFGNYWNRLMGLAGIGQQNTGAMGGALQNAGNNISQLQGDMGNAQAGYHINAANARGNAFGNLMGLGGTLGGAFLGGPFGAAMGGQMFGGGGYGMGSGYDRPI